MDEKIDTFNWDLKWFLSNLTTFQRDVNTSNKTTLQLLNKALDAIISLSDGLVIVETNDLTGPIFDAEKFLVQRSIFCRLCKVSFPAKSTDYCAHVANCKHSSATFNASNKEIKESVGADSSNVAIGKLNTVAASSQDSKEKSKVESWLAANELVKPSINSNSTDSKAQPQPTKRSFDQNIFDLIDSLCSSPKVEQEADVTAAKSNAESVCSTVSRSECSIFIEKRLSKLSLQPSVSSKSSNGQNGSAKVSPNQLSNLNNNSAGAIPKKRDEQSSNQSKKSAIAPPATGNQVSPSAPIANEGAGLKAFYENDLNRVLLYVTDKGDKLSNRSSHTTVIDSIQALIKNRFKSVECRLIGSRSNGIATTFDENASLDIYLDLNKSFLNDGANEDIIIKQRMEIVRNLMKFDGEWSNVKQSQYGILSVTHNYTKLKCCLIFGRGECVSNNDLIKCYFNAQKVCRSLVFSIRLSMKEVSAGWTKNFSGYIVSLLVIFYFQSIKQLPPAKDLGNLSSLTGIVSRKEQLSTLLMKIFEFYSKFDFKERIISVFEGKAIGQSIRHMSNRSLTPSVANFKGLMESDTVQWQKGMMCIQDIFLHGNNVTASINSTDVNEFKNYCKHSLNILRAAGASLRY